MIAGMDAGNDALRFGDPSHVVANLENLGSALQEAGLIGISPVAHMPRLSMLGIFPSWQPLLLQALILAALFIGFRYNARRQVS